MTHSSRQTTPRRTPQWVNNLYRATLLLENNQDSLHSRATPLPENNQGSLHRRAKHLLANNLRSLVIRPDKMHSPHLRCPPMMVLFPRTRWKRLH